MIVLLVILILAAIGGIAAYLILQYTNVLPTVSQEPRLGTGWRDRGARVSLPGRLEEVPQGCLVSVLVFMAVWILAWLIVLIIGLRVLLA